MWQYKWEARKWINVMLGGKWINVMFGDGRAEIMVGLDGLTGLF